MGIFFFKPQQEMVSIRIEATKTVDFRKIDLSIKQTGQWNGQRFPQSVTIEAPKHRLDEIIEKLSRYPDVTKVNDQFTENGQALQDRLRIDREEMNRRFEFGKK